MLMKHEILIIDENKKLLLLQALNLHRNQTQAARALGISQPTVNRLTARFNIIKEDGVYKERQRKIFS